MYSPSPLLLATHTANIRRPYPASAKDWEEKREIIQCLYCTEDLPLSKVAGRMKELYGFDATPRQYRQRIAEWHLDKNVKEEEMRAMIKLHDQRDREGKRSIFYVRGRLVDSKKMARFRKRKSNRKDLRGLKDLPPDVRCYTPDKSRPESVVAEGGLQIEPDSSTLPVLEPNVAFEKEDIMSRIYGISQANDPSGARRNGAGKEREFYPHPPVQCNPPSNPFSTSLVVLDHFDDRIGQATDSRSMHALSVRRSVPITHLGTKVRNEQRLLQPLTPATSAYTHNETAERTHPDAFQDDKYLSTLTRRSPMSSHSTTLYGFDTGRPDSDYTDAADRSMLLDFKPPERVPGTQYDPHYDKEAQLGSPDSLQSDGNLSSTRITTSSIPLPDTLLLFPTNITYFSQLSQQHS